MGGECCGCGLIPPWTSPSIGVEALRWFDYWLKGIDNGIMDEPPVQYFVTGMPNERVWRSVKIWPLQDSSPARFYFAQGKSGSIASANDGLLRKEAPSAPDEGEPK